MSNWVSILDTGYDSFAVEAQLLAAAGYRLRVFPGERHDLAGKIAFARDSVGLLLRWTVVDAAFLAQFPQLRAIGRYGVGYDNIDLAAAQAAGVQVANVRGYANHAVSDHTLALLFGVLRGLKDSAAHLRRAYTHPGRSDTFELHQKTLGIIGLGRIGSTFCRKARGLFREVLAYDPYLSEAQCAAAGAQASPLGDLLERAHVISIHCNLSAETQHLIDASAFAQMAQVPILINTARGGIVHEQALLEALRQDGLFGLGIDVFAEEPPGPEMQELIDHPRVIATGHNAWYSQEAQAELQRRAASNLLAMLEGAACEDRLC